MRRRAEAVRADRSGRCRMHAPAVESRLELLIGREAGDIHDRVGPVRPVGAIASRARHRAGHQAAVVAPVEAEPRAASSRLVLQVRGLVELLVVVDAEYADRRRESRRCRRPAARRSAPPRWTSP